MATQHSFSSVSSASRYSASSNTSSHSHASTRGTIPGSPSFPRKLTLVSSTARQESPTYSPPSYNSPSVNRSRPEKPNLPRQLTLVPGGEGNTNFPFRRPYSPIPTSPTLLDSPRSAQYQTPPKTPTPFTDLDISHIAPYIPYFPPSHIRTVNKSTSSAKAAKPATTKKPLLARRLGGGIRPLGTSFLVGLAALLSIFFIVSVSMVFVGAAGDEDPFKELLDSAAKNNPGILLLGENVDVDVDEPAVTIRWSVIACGVGFVLSGSEGIHGSNGCGTPNQTLSFYVDNNVEAEFTYNPLQFPYLNGTGQLRSIQSLFQFDSSYTLDVHEQRLYPFDTYRLGSTLHAESDDNDQDVVISRLVTAKSTSSFVISSNDVSGYVETDDATHSPRREIDLIISRPGGTRTFALFMFAVNWMLAHATVGFLLLALHAEQPRRATLLLSLTFVIVFAIPQIRRSMPDAPGYDGVLIDCVGFFPQMIMAGTSAISLTFIVTAGELSTGPGKAGTKDASEKTPGPSTASQRRRRAGSSIDISRLRSFTFGQMSTIKEKDEELGEQDVERQDEPETSVRGHRRMPGQSVHARQSVTTSSYRRPMGDIRPVNNTTFVSSGRTFI